MESLEKYGILSEGKLQFESKACGIARVSLVGHPEAQRLVAKLTELQLSYFNQFGLTVKAYQRLHQLFRTLNETDDKGVGNNFSPYDLKAEELRDDVQQTAYLFVVTLKTLLDLYVGIVDFALYKEVREESKIPALGSQLPTSGYPPSYKQVSEELNAFKNAAWVKDVTNIRNNIVHRGYALIADISFVKQDRLSFKQERGVGASVSSAGAFDLGSLLDVFLSNMPSLDEVIGNLISVALNTPVEEQAAKAIFIIEGGMTILYHDGISRWE